MKYDYGDTVRVALNAPLELRPNALGEVVGMRLSNTSKDSHAESDSEAIAIYTVEYGDGTSLEVAEEWLQRE